jgi:hypothetical protein
VNAGGFGSGGGRFGDGGFGGGGVFARLSGSNLRWNTSCSELILFLIFLNHPSTVRNSKLN